jgi:hypothetical protein
VDRCPATTDFSGPGSSNLADQTTEDQRASVRYAQPMTLKGIISGGQTGADQGGLAAAQELGISTGGTAAQGWLTEDGPKPDLLQRFGLTECREPGYPARTKQNVLDADGTLLVGPYRTGGSELTARIARENNKPLFHLAYAKGAIIHPQDERLEEFRYWLTRYNIQTLNVAGNRESTSPGIQAFTRVFIVAAFR